MIQLPEGISRKDLETMIDLFSSWGKKHQTEGMIEVLSYYLTISGWKQRAEAAEAALAELGNQKPVAMRYRWSPPHMKMPDGSKFYGEWKLTHDPETANPGKDYERVNLYARPAPAINLAELVPPGTSCIGWVRDEIKEHDKKWIEMLRNIEEQSK